MSATGRWGKWGVCPDCGEPLNPLGICMQCDEDEDGENETPVVPMAPPEPTEEELLQKYRKARIGLLLMNISMKDLAARCGYKVSTIQFMRAPSGTVSDRAARLLERVGGQEEGWLDRPTGKASLRDEPGYIPAEPREPEQAAAEPEHAPDPLIDDEKRPNDDGEGAEPGIRRQAEGLPAETMMPDVAFPIVHNRPKPEPRASMYPFRYMKPGDCFPIAVGDSTVSKVRSRVRTAWLGFLATTGNDWKFSTTVEEENGETVVYAWRDS